ncbi:helix-turn-helix domain-containing protein [Rhodobacteraceae bacterium D3-12]|nr:helix-turn-helix domain-containing protein [Rhodobacteraceae bacterium D3-12]
MQADTDGERDLQDSADIGTNPTDPAELRGIFGANLRQLAKNYASVAGLCRELGINRTQFNRYLSGESFPRPDVLHRVCVFFNVDARILLEPVDSIKPATAELFAHPDISNFLGNGSARIDEETFPSGFYRFSRPSFVERDLFVIGLVYVYRKDGFCLVRGYEPREAMAQQGLSADPSSREFRGIFIRQEQGVAALIARNRALTCSFNFLSRVSSYENNFWEGYATRTVRESHNSRRAARMVYEHIQLNQKAIFETARTCGMKRREELHPFHAKLLNLDMDFK